MNITPELFEANLNLVLHGIFFFLLLIFTIHTILLGYHWFTYGMKRHTSLLALCIYLSGGALFFLIMGALLL
jgi:uncharacterized protein YacL